MISSIVKSRYGAETAAEFAGFPDKVSYDGLTYHFTGKVGTSFKTDAPAAEYSACTKHPEFGEMECRVWRDADGTITPD